MTNAAPLARFLGSARLLFDTFGVHLPGQPARTVGLAQALSNVADTEQFFADAAAALGHELSVDRQLNGPDGAVSADARSSLSMIRHALEHLSSLCDSAAAATAAPSYAAKAAPRACTTLSVERLFAIIRGGEAMPTVLRYQQLIAEAGREFLKQVTSCSFNYPTARAPFYPDPATGLPFAALRLPSKPSRPTNIQYFHEEMRLMKAWCQSFFRPASQNRVRVLSKWNPGTLPLNTMTSRIDLRAANPSPMELTARASDLAEGKELLLPERKDETVLLAVRAGFQPSVLEADTVLLARVKAADYDNHAYEKMQASWFVESPGEPQVFRMLASAPLDRAGVIAEIAPEVSYVDEDHGQECLLVNEVNLHSLLLRAASLDGGELADPESAVDSRLDADAYNHFGASQELPESQQSQSSRSERSERRHKRKADSSAASSQSSQNNQSQASNAARGRGRGRGKGKS